MIVPQCSKAERAYTARKFPRSGLALVILNGFEAMRLNLHVVEAGIYRCVDEEQGGYIYDTPACE